MVKNVRFNDYSERKYTQVGGSGACTKVQRYSLNTIVI